MIFLTFCHQTCRQHVSCHRLQRERITSDTHTTSIVMQTHRMQMPCWIENWKVAPYYSRIPSVCTHTHPHTRARARATKRFYLESGWWAQKEDTRSRFISITNVILFDFHMIHLHCRYMYSTHFQRPFATEFFDPLSRLLCFVAFNFGSFVARNKLKEVAQHARYWRFNLAIGFMSFAVGWFLCFVLLATTFLPPPPSPAHSLRILHHTIWDAFNKMKKKTR